MRNIGHKLLLSSLVLIVGASTACAGILVGFQRPGESFIGLRGSIGIDDWERSPIYDDVFLPDMSQIERMANSGSALDNDGFPLDQMATGSIGGKRVEKEIIWERFDSRGSQVPNGLTDWK